MYESWPRCVVFSFIFFFPLHCLLPHSIKQKPNLIIVLLYIERNKKNTCLCFFTDGKKNKASELDMITLRNHAPRSYTTWLAVTLTWLAVTLTWLLNNLQLWRHRRGFRKLTVRFRPIRKEIVSSMYNKRINWIYHYCFSYNCAKSNEHSKYLPSFSGEKWIESELFEWTHLKT